MSPRDGRLGWRDVAARAPARGRILLVDDDPEVRGAVTRIVARLGHDVRPVASAEEADQWLALQSFEVCLLDVNLPRMTGVEFLSWALVRDPELAVIMLTGVDDHDVAVECLEGGARSYLVKPVDGAFLRLALRDALAMKGLLSERNDLTRT